MGPEYYEITDILEDKSTLVFDTGVFNRSRGRSNLLDRLKQARRIPNQELWNGGIEALCPEIESEIKYIEFWTDDLQKRDNRITTRGIGLELLEYYKIIKSFKEKTEGNLGVALQDLEIALSFAVAGVFEHAITLAEQLIERNKPRFDQYVEWLTKFTELDEAERLRRATKDDEITEFVRTIRLQHGIEDPPSQDPPFVEKYHSRKKDRANDNELVALSLISAWEHPTTVLTLDARDVGNASKTIYGKRSNLGLEVSFELPPNPYKVFVGFEEGWRLWLDSAHNPPIK